MSTLTVPKFLATLTSDQARVLTSEGVVVTTDLRFEWTPNVYFLSFDGMISQRLSKKYMSVDNPVYIDVLDRFNPIYIPNIFADMVPTKYSLSSLLLLGLGPSSIGRADSIVSGRSRDVLKEIFRHNNYTTHLTLYYSYFGPRSGPFLDDYNIFIPYNACSLMNEVPKKFAFFGYCLIRARVLSGDTAQRNDNYDGYALKFLRHLLGRSSDRPYFYMEHVFAPGHAPSSYAGSVEEKEAYIKTYQQGSALAAESMERTLNEILENDPEALIYIYSDHGAYLSNHIRFKEDPEFYVQDRFGTIGAVINGERCRPFLAPPEGENFQTVSRVALGVIKCLTGAMSPFSKDINYGRIRQIDGNEMFQTYVLGE